jgi:hypothetical protein
VVNSVNHDRDTHYAKTTYFSYVFTRQTFLVGSYQMAENLFIKIKRLEIAHFFEF